MRHWTRREFLTASAGVTIGLHAPGVFGMAAVAESAPKKPRVLVVVELTGGNDGLNTVVPFRDPLYAKARPGLRQRSGQVQKIDDEIGFHPALSGLAELLESSELAIVQGVGYPQPNRSHFESMDIWHKASRSPEERFGWLGRAAMCGENGPAGVSVGGGESPLALLSEAGHANVIRSLDALRLKTAPGPTGRDRQAVIEKVAAAPGRSESAGELLRLVSQSATTAHETARRLEKAARSETVGSFPATGLGRRLELVARLIAAEVPERVFYTTLAGFDTHAAQAETHAALLSELGGALRALQRSLRESGHAQRVLTMTFSEFGRRVRENGSGGTDHGVASQMFLVGPQVRPGLIGAHPPLDDLTDGDLKHHTDFRSVYATILDGWLGVDSPTVLGQKYEPVPALKS